MLKFDDSMINLHRICQIPSSLSVYTTFGLCDGSKNFDIFDKIESNEWPNLVPFRLRVGNCFEIQLPR